MSTRQGHRSSRLASISLTPLLVLLVGGLVASAYAGVAHSGGPALLNPVHGAPASVGAAPSKSASTPHFAKAPAATTPSWTVPRLAPWHLGGHTPQSWHGSPIPPGAPVPTQVVKALDPKFPTGTSDGINWTALNQYCNGLFPSRGGQAAYLPGCYGHDEPGINPYSTLPGSGGNVTWNVTLPIDRSPTQNQSNLYATMWFGMALWDPYAWMDQCFLELQLYPDSTFTVPVGTVQGVWVGAAVAWQIQASSGFEDPCYYSPLFVVGAPPGTYFQMTQGDNLSVTMSGWTSSPYGENITVNDTTSGQVAFLNLFNTTGNYPIDPAYSTSSFPNALQWTPGGEYPVSFAMETGHAANPLWPENDSFGGCSPGAPPSTPQDPAVPCPSYDPGFWANDTLVPWQIHPPTFFNALSRETPTQVAFTQDLGGLDYIDGSNLFGSFGYTCLGHEMSAYCTYPWYSYSCAEHAYNFGAIDWATTTTDFGQSSQYDRVATSNAMALGFYPPNQEPVPACGATSYSLTVTPGTGGIDIFNAVRTTTGTIGGLLPGHYEISAVPSGSTVFTSWGTTGGASVSNMNSIHTTLTLTGSGSVSALFGLGLTSAITFDDSAPGGMVSVVPHWFNASFGLESSPASWTVPNGGSLNLKPGFYTASAYPPLGFNFTTWGGATTTLGFAATGLPVTWFIVPEGTVSATIWANSTASTQNALVIVEGIPTGATVWWNNTPQPVVNSSLLVLPNQVVGTYALNITLPPMVLFSDWLYGGTAVLSNFTQSTWVDVEQGTTLLLPLVHTVQAITLNDAPAAGTYIAWNGSLGKPNGTSVTSIGGPGSPTFNLAEALAPAGMAFSKWTTNDPTTVWIQTPTASETIVGVNATGNGAANLTAWYAPAAALTVTFDTAPASGGFIAWVDHSLLVNGTVNSSVAPGIYTMLAIPAFGETAVSFTGSANVTWLPTFLPGPLPGGALAGTANITGTATITANFVATLYPVTFVATDGASTATINGSATSTGDTVWLPVGSYPLVGTAAAGSTFANWSTTSSLLLSNPTILAPTLTVLGAGTVNFLTAAPVGPFLLLVTVLPAGGTILPGGTFSITAAAVCTGNTACTSGTTFAWSEMTPSLGSLNTTTGTSVKFTAAVASGFEGITVVGSKGPTSVLSAVVGIAIVPQITSASISGGASVFTTTTNAYSATAGCTGGLPCPAGTTFTWSTTGGVGTLNATTGPSVSLTASATPASGTIALSAFLNAVYVNISTPVAVVVPALVSVSVAPTTVSLNAGTAVQLNSTIGCSLGLACPTGTTYSWSVAPSGLGTVSTTSGASTTFTAGSGAGRGNVSVNATLNGVTMTAKVPFTIAVVQTIVSVTISPTALSVATGALLGMTATATCSPAPCPATVAYAWSDANTALGLLNRTGGSTVTFAAGTAAGTATVWVNATLNGHTVSSGAQTLTVTSSSTSSSSSLVSNPYFWVAVVVVLVVIVGLAVWMMRRGKGGTSVSPPSSMTPPTDPNAPKM